MITTVGNKAVTTAPSILIDGRLYSKGLSDPVLAIIENYDVADMFVGGSTVAVSGATRGLRIAPGSTLALQIRYDDILYSVSGSTLAVCVFYARA